MGEYLLHSHQHPPKGKAGTLVESHGARLCMLPSSFREIPVGKYLVCVVDNGSWEAAGVVYDEREFMRFTVGDPSGRTKTWLLMDRAEVERMNPGVRERL